jgi:hypothetical protein
MFTCDLHSLAQAYDSALPSGRWARPWWAGCGPGSAPLVIWNACSVCFDFGLIAQQREV